MTAIPSMAGPPDGSGPPPTRALGEPPSGRDGTPLTGLVFSGHSGFPRGFGYSHTLTPRGQGSLRFAPRAANPRPARCH